MLSFATDCSMISQEAESVFEGVFQRDPKRRTASAQSFIYELGLALRTRDQPDDHLPNLPTSASNKRTDLDVSPGHSFS